MVSAIERFHCACTYIVHGRNDELVLWPAGLLWICSCGFVMQAMATCATFVNKLYVYVLHEGIVHVQTCRCTSYIYMYKCMYRYYMHKHTSYIFKFYCTCSIFVFFSAVLKISLASAGR